MNLCGMSKCVNQSSDPVFQAVTWFRAEDKSPKVKLIRKIAALFAACLLSLTIVGIYFVIKGSIIWMQETKKVSEAAKQLAVVTKTEELAKQLADAKQAVEEKKQLAAAKRAEVVTKQQAAAKLAAEQLAAAKREEELLKQQAAARRSAEEAKQLAAAKRAEVVTKQQAAARQSAEETKQLAAQLTSTSAMKKIEEEAKQAWTSMVGASFARVEKKSGTIAPSSPSVGSSTPIAKKDQNGFPTPFESLKKMNMYQPEEFQKIIEKANTALITPKKERIVPSEYVKLEENWEGPKARLEQLYDEAKIIAHNIALKELGSLANNRSEYQKCFFPFLRMLLDYLHKHKRFPSDIHAWAESGV